MALKLSCVSWEKIAEMSCLPNVLKQRILIAIPLFLIPEYSQSNATLVKLFQTYILVVYDSSIRNNSLLPLFSDC